MKNKNNKGFFLSETMVVIAIVAIVLLSVFKIFSSVYTKYKESENYNTINATNTAVQLKKYYQSIGLDYTTLLGGNYYVDLTNSATYDSEHYDNLKLTLKVDKVYLVNMAQVFTGTNINVFNTSLRKYLKTLQNSNSSVSLITISDGSEYGSISVVTAATVALNGDSNNEYETVVPLDGTFTDPGYINWSGNPPTITWETALDTTKEGTYYAKYSFDGFILRRRVVVAKVQYNYYYTGAVQSLVAPCTGYYKVQLWGAGGNTWNGLINPGLGGYTSGIIYLSKDETLYVYVGSNSASFNGGSVGGKLDATEIGGGSTDVRLVGGAWNDATSLNSRIMVAGAGGGTGEASGKGGTGGGLIASNGATTGSGSGATQKAGGAGGTTATVGSPGGFGYGGAGGLEATYGRGGSGGSGYYGGGGGSGISGTDGAGGGGSSFISGFAGANAITSSSSTTPTNNVKHYSGKYFINTDMKSGQNVGPGSAKITFLGTTSPSKTNTNLNNVRYIKDCRNGDSVNNGNYWVELQAIYQGTNIAKGLSVTGTSTVTNGVYATDGDMNSTNYASAAAGSLQCITIDLGQLYNLDEIAVWHYWADGRTVYSNVTYVSSDNTNWTTLINTGNIPAISEGKRVNAWN